MKKTTEKNPKKGLRTSYREFSDKMTKKGVPLLWFYAFIPFIVVGTAGAWPDWFGLLGAHILWGIVLAPLLLFALGALAGGLNSMGAEVPDWLMWFFL